MALDLDGFQAWRAIAAHAQLFASLKAEATKSVRGFMAAFFKSKSTGLADIRAAHKALAPGIFDLIVDGMKDGALKSLVARLDKYHPDQKQADPVWRRRHLCSLASGSADPATKTPAKPSRRASASKRPAKGDARGRKGRRYVSAGAVRKI
jgi:16S rRNA G1207 methylase RsmC